MKPSQHLVARVQAARRLAAKSKGPDLRSKLNNARIGLNNIQSRYGRGSGDVNLQAAVKDLEGILQEITSVLFAIRNDEAKAHIVKSVISEVNQAISAAKTGDQAGIEIGAGRASTFLDGAIEHLAANPDADEQKETFARYLDTILSHEVTSGSSETLMERALKLCNELGVSEASPKNRQFYIGVALALRGYIDAQKELRSAAAFAYKILPKVR